MRKLRERRRRQDIAEAKALLNAGSSSSEAEAVLSAAQNMHGDCTESEGPLYANYGEEPEPAPEAVDPPAQDDERGTETVEIQGDDSAAEDLREVCETLSDLQEELREEENLYTAKKELAIAFAGLKATSICSDQALEKTSHSGSTRRSGWPALRNAIGEEIARRSST